METDEVVVNVEMTEDGVSLLYETPKQKLTLQILEIRRYIVDGIFLRTMGLTEDQCPLHEAFDVILSDGEKKTKCLLSPFLNELIYKHHLDIYYVVEVSDWEVRLDEWKGAVPFIVIKNIAASNLDLQPDDILSVHAVNESWQEPKWHPKALQQAIAHIKKREYVKKMSKIKELAKPQEKENTEQSEYDIQTLDDYLLNRPMVGNRGSYLALECNDSVVGSQWKSSASKYIHFAQKLEEIFINDYEEYATIREIKSHYSNQIGASKRAKSSPPFLVARILKKRSINNYATALQKDNRYPFNFTVTIGDHTGQIDMIIWASWCVRYFNTLQVGDVIIIRNYRIRHSYEKENELELVVNPYNPVGDIRILMGPVLDKFAIPGIPLRLLGSKTLLTSPTIPNQEVDHVGVVTFVSRLIRIRTDNSFSAMVWLKVRDHHSSKDIPVKLFANSQLETLKKIQLGDVVLLTNLKIVSFSLFKDLVTDFIFLESTHFTEIYTTEEIKVLNLSHTNEVLKLAQTIDLTQEKRELETTKLNNYYLQCPNIAIFKDIFHLATDAPTFFGEIESKLNELHFRESKILYVYAFLVSLKVTTQKDRRVVYNARLTDLNRKKILDAVIPMSHLSVMDALNLKPSNKRERIEVLLHIFHSFSDDTTNETVEQNSFHIDTFPDLNFGELHNRMIREGTDEDTSLAILVDELAQQPLYFTLDCYYGESSQEIVITNIFREVKHY